jgi:hypothetical protein
MKSKEQDVKEGTIAVCIALFCVVVLLLAGYSRERHHRQRYRSLLRKHVALINQQLHQPPRSQERPARPLRARAQREMAELVAEQRATLHARNHTPNRTVQARLLAAAANHTLYICAGLGTTGTSALERALAKLGLRTAKWGHEVVQPSGKPVRSEIMEALLQPSPRFFALFNGVDAVLDTPIVDYLPHLLDAYPHSKLILTHRDPSEWAQRRAHMHPCAPPPFAAWYGKGTLALEGRPTQARDANGRASASRHCARTPEFVLRHASLAWTAYVQALAEKLHVPLLELNVFREHDRQLWRKLGDFVNASRAQRRKARGTFGCFTSKVCARNRWDRARRANWTRAHRHVNTSAEVRRGVVEADVQEEEGT